MSGSDPLFDADTIAALARPVFRAHGIKRAILFGSFATGRQSRRSDVDLILVKDTDKRYFDRYDGILMDLYESIPGKDIDVLIYTPREFLLMKRRRFIRKALEEGKVIYESGQGTP